MPQRGILYIHLSAPALSIDIGQSVSSLEEPIVFTLPLSESTRDPASPDYVIHCLQWSENGELTLNKQTVFDAQLTHGQVRSLGHIPGHTHIVGLSI